MLKSMKSKVKTTTSRAHRGPFLTLRAYFRATHTSQRALARLLDVSQSTLSMLAAGKRTARYPLAVRIATITGVPIKALMTLPRPRATRSAARRGSSQMSSRSDRTVTGSAPPCALSA